MCSGLRDNGLGGKSALSPRGPGAKAEAGAGARAGAGAALKKLARRSGCIGGDGSGSVATGDEADSFFNGDDG